MYESLSQYYDLFIDEQLYDVYLDLIKKHHPSGMVLDLGCGTGPLALKLAKHGYAVTGTDQSQHMLETAYNNAVKEGVHINLYLHDILDPIAGVYDVYTMASDVINYVLEDDSVRQVFKNISEVMRQDSLLVFDFLRPQFVKDLVGHKETIELEDESFTWEVTSTDEPLRIEHMLSFENASETHLQQTHPLKFYKSCLNDVDLFIVKKHKTKERIICVCKKL